MLYRMERNPDWKVLRNIVPALSPQFPNHDGIQLPSPPCDQHSALRRATLRQVERLEGNSVANERLPMMRTESNAQPLLMLADAPLILWKASNVSPPDTMLV
jgi:hypothetical protein